jgi:hypothetical protein
MTGRAVLKGALDIVVAPSYDPPPGQTFTILTAGKVEGAFTTVTGNILPSGKRLEPEYSATAVTVRVMPAQ